MDVRINRREFLLASGVIAAAPAARLVSGEEKQARVRAVGLRVDYADRPLGLSNTHPRFSWRLESESRGVLQSAYRVLVSTSRAVLRQGQGDLWDSDVVKSRRSFGIRYQGRQLMSRQ